MSTLDHVTGLVCTICGNSYDVGDVDYVCPLHGNEGTLDVRYDYDLIGSRLSRGSLAAQSKTSTRARHLDRWRATTKPSPPLLPGPTRTITGRSRRL